VAPVVFDNVSKKFRRGERHNSLRDLVPAIVRSTFRKRPADTLRDQEFWALRNVSFEVEAGRALGIIGANGAGKSTTLKVLTKILRPTTGRCAVKGRIGALIEVAAGFHAELTGRENVYLQGAIMGMKRAEISERFDEIVEFAGVADSIDTPVKRYSSGMNARLGFSIAAHLRPDVLIIDEVLSVGDITFQQKCFDRMLEFKRQGIAIVLVSHNLQAVGMLCEQAIYLAHSVKAMGPTTEILEAYVRDAQKVPQSDDGVITITSVSLSTPTETLGTHAEILPKTPMTLRIVARSSKPIDDVTFRFMIHRSTDQLMVFDGQVHRRELGSVAEFQGEFTLDFRFRAHLVAGHYYLSMWVFHNPTRQALMGPQQLATLAITESQSRTGIVDVDFSAALETRAEVSEVAR
jgi:homopolymeric O-antigen transport system ATP-binding protein